MVQLGLTLFNKVVLVSFPFPYVRLAYLSGLCQGISDASLPLMSARGQTLTGLHTLSGCIGSFYALNRGHFVRSSLPLAPLNHFC